jgi:hypothetical protein
MYLHVQKAAAANERAKQTNVVGGKTIDIPRARSGGLDLLPLHKRGGQPIKTLV